MLGRLVPPPKPSNVGPGIGDELGKSGFHRRNAGNLPAAEDSASREVRALREERERVDVARVQDVAPVKSRIRPAIVLGVVRIGEAPRSLITTLMLCDHV